MTLDVDTKDSRAKTGVKIKLINIGLELHVPRGVK